MNKTERIQAKRKLEQESLQKKAKKYEIYPLFSQEQYEQQLIEKDILNQKIDVWQQQIMQNFRSLQ